MGCCLPQCINNEREKLFMQLAACENAEVVSDAQAFC